MPKHKSLLKNERPANGVKGTLLRAAGKNNELIFRVYKYPSQYRVGEGLKKGRGEDYDKNAWDHVDYDITHYDLEIIIEDRSAAFYDINEKRSVLDYSTEAMTPVKLRKQK